MTENSKSTIAVSPSALIFLGLVIVALVGFGGYMYGKVGILEKGTVPTNTNNQAQAQPQAQAQQQQPQTDATKIPTVSDKDHIRGNKNAQVLLVEYSDYECPYCKAFHPTMLQIMKDYGNKVAWIFRDYPLPFHPKAEKSAEATECAAELGGNDAFWKMTDLIYEKMPGMELSQLPDLAKQIGLDQGKFKSCLDSGKYASQIKAEEDGGIAGGVQGTPGTFVIGKNGKTDFIGGAYPVDQAKLIIDKVLAN